MIKVGIERFLEVKSLFEGERVGLITNPTGVLKDFTSTIDILADHTDLRALYAPEHGVRGDLQAGERLETYTDEKTGVPVYSLYGATKKPTAEMLSDIDVLCFDIQDVGARFYTYIYTMAYAMMAAKENGKRFIVFDRPNPVGGEVVEGNILDLDFRSFVGYYELPQRHGLTVGELANYFNQKYEIGCDLEVVEMEGYIRAMHYDILERPWVMPSPNIPTTDTLYAFLATCVFEGTNLSEGRGTARPFHIIGAPWLDHETVIKKINAYDLPGVMFRPLYFTPTFQKHKGELCRGIELHITDKFLFNPVETGFILLYLIRETNDAFAFNAPYKEGMHPMIDLLTGTDSIRKHTIDIEALRKKIREDAVRFKAEKVSYHIYE